MTSLPFGKGYCDLNIPAGHGTDGTSHTDVVRRALALGYQTLALCVTINQDELTSKKQQTKKSKEDIGLSEFPEPPSLDLSEKDYPDLSSKGKKPVLLSRLNIVFKDNEFLTFYNRSKTVGKYDLISVCPESISGLQNLLKSGFKPDIISFDQELALNLRWNRKLYEECVDKSIFFELTYSPMIRDTTARRRTISQGHSYHSVGRSKNVIISSEALSPIELRGPHDVANLGLLLALNEHQGKAAVKELPCRAIKSGSGRKLGPFRASVVALTDLEPEDAWKIPSEPDPDTSSDSSSSDVEIRALS